MMRAMPEQTLFRMNYMDIAGTRTRKRDCRLPVPGVIGHPGIFIQASPDQFAGYWFYLDSSVKLLIVLRPTQAVPMQMLTLSTGEIVDQIQW